MRIMKMDRGTGKTEMLVRSAHMFNVPLIVATDAQKLHLRAKYGKDYITIFSVSDVVRGDARGYITSECLVDDIDNVLALLLGKAVIAGTITEY